MDENENDTTSPTLERESEDEKTKKSVTEMLRNEDPKLTRVLVSSRYFSDYDAFLEWTLALQKNRIVDEIECLFGLREEINDAFDYSPLLHVIRTRTQLQKLVLYGISRTFNISPFISAAAENPALECLHLRGRSPFSSESIERLQAHPNLREIQFHVNPSDDPVLTKIDTFVRIIETCPLLDSVRLRTDFQLSVDILRPVIKALCNRQPKLTLLLGGCPVDENATTLLQDFLQNYPKSVHLCVDYFSFELSLSEPLSSWLPQLLCPSIHSLTLIFDECKETAARTVSEIKKVMASLKDEKTRNIKELQMDIFGDDGLYAFQAIFDDIPDLLFVNKITVCYFTSNRSASPTPFMKEKLLDALAKNTSVEKLTFEVFGENGQDICCWTNLEKERLENLLQRNVSISHFMAIPVCYNGRDDQADQSRYLRSQEVKLEVKEVITCLNQLEGRNIKEVEFVFTDYEPDHVHNIFQAVFDGMPDILFVTEFTLYYSTLSGYSDEFLQQHDPFSFLKKKLLDALAKNISIQKMDLEIRGYRQNFLEWTDLETKQLEFLRLRNKSISQFMATPKSSPLSAWPYFLETVQTTVPRLSLVFQFLRENADILPVLCEDTDAACDTVEVR